VKLNLGLLPLIPSYQFPLPFPRLCVAAQFLERHEDIAQELPDPVSLSVQHVPRPCLFISRVSRIPSTDLELLTNGTDGPLAKAAVVRRPMRTKDIPGDLLVAYFNSKADAYEALLYLKNTSFTGIRLAATYKYVTAPLCPTALCSQARKIAGFFPDMTRSHLTPPLLRLPAVLKNENGFLFC